MNKKKVVKDLASGLRQYNQFTMSYRFPLADESIPKVSGLDVDIDRLHRVEDSKHLPFLAVARDGGGLLNIRAILIRLTRHFS